MHGVGAVVGITVDLLGLGVTLLLQSYSQEALLAFRHSVGHRNRVRPPGPVAEICSIPQAETTALRMSLLPSQSPSLLLLLSAEGSPWPLPKSTVTMPEDTVAHGAVHPSQRTRPGLRSGRSGNRYGARGRIGSSTKGGRLRATMYRS